MILKKKTEVTRKDVRLGCMQVWSKRKRKKAEVAKGKERETKETYINKLEDQKD